MALIMFYNAATACSKGSLCASHINQSDRVVLGMLANVKVRCLWHLRQQAHAIDLPNSNSQCKQLACHVHKLDL